VSDQAIILLAEDREDDILLIRRALARAYIFNPLQAVRNGDEAIAYLKGDGKFANRAEYPVPDLLILDLNMPIIDGFEVLRWIRHEPTLSSLRVVILTSSNRLQDINAAYQLGANSFLVKTMGFDQFVETVKATMHYWLRLDRAPEIHRPAPNETSRISQGRS
jgi:CheY-like chemotaxis protein